MSGVPLLNEEDMMGEIDLFHRTSDVENNSESDPEYFEPVEDSEDSFAEERERAIAEEERLAVAWGKNRKGYYDADDDEDEDDEEVEARRMRAAQLAAAYEDDFLDVGIEGKGGDTMAAVERDATGLSSEAKEDIVSQQMPELLDVLAKLKEAAAIVETRAAEWTGEAPEGVSLMSVKMELMTSYCMNLGFYLLAKAEGAKIDNRVLERLVELRTIMEKLAPLEKRIKDSAERVQLQQSGGEGVRARVGDFREVEGRRAVEYEEDLEKSRRKREDRLEKKAKNSELLAAVRDEFGEAPREESVEDSRIMDAELERREYEEENYMRLPATKKSRAIEKQRESIGAWEDIDDFRDLAPLVGHAEDEELDFEALRKEALSGKRDTGRTSRDAGIAFDDDDDDIDYDLGMQTYNQGVAQTQKKLQRKKDMYPEPKQFYGEDKDFVKEGNRRKASKKIVQNLTTLKRYRNKDDKNPRKKFRKKFEKAEIKRKSMNGKKFAGQGGTYGGESSGFKDTVTRGTKLTQ